MFLLRLCITLMGLFVIMIRVLTGIRLVLLITVGMGHHTIVREVIRTLIHMETTGLITVPGVPLILITVVVAIRIIRETLITTGIMVRLIIMAVLILTEIITARRCVPWKLWFALMVLL